MQPETNQKPVMDVKAPPAKQGGESAPVAKTETEHPVATVAISKKPAAKQKGQPAELPVTAIVLTILAMLVLCGLAVVVYMKSH